MSESIETLGPKMAARLVKLEERVEKGLVAFADVGNALHEIREQRLYRINYDTFDEYARVRWHMSGTQAHRLIDAAEIVGLLNGLPAPRHEAHARALVPLRKDPERLQAVWREVTTADPQPTAQRVQEAVRAVLTPAKTPGQAEVLPPPVEPAEPRISVHVGVDLDLQQAKAALTYLLDCHRLPPGLLTIRAQIESQLATMDR